MKNQITNTILMVEPINFNYNPQTAVNNYFQKKNTINPEETQKKALNEFKGMVNKLREHGINVITLKDTINPNTPDSIFPNNWISFHSNGNIAIYPMFAKNRREERRLEEVIILLEKNGFSINDIYDYTTAEEDNLFLEGTGSIILDRDNNIAYAALSERTNENLLFEFCEDFQYTPFTFIANQTVNNERQAIYHTNVMMCVANNYVVICLDSIDNVKEKKALTNQFHSTNKEIINITEEQMHQFAGNMLQVQGLGQPYLVMSQSAYNSLSKDQIKQIEKHNPIIPVNIEWIEKLGGGSARCMMAEVFLPKK